MTDAYADVTEAPGLRGTREQLSMLYTRYHTAVGYGESKAVLEVACGPGMGLGYLAQRAHLLVGCDYSPVLLNQAQHHYGHRVPLLRLDAHALPFGDGVFDLVILYEAIYYLSQPEQFVAEAWRVLRPGGTFLISTANKERPSFVPSPHSHRYFSAPELHGLLISQPFKVDLFGAFPTAEETLRGKLLSIARRVVVSLNLVPGTLKGRELLKRLAYGRLQEFMPEVTEAMASLAPLTPILPTQPTKEYKVLYAIGHR